MKPVCGVPHPGDPETKCQKPPHTGEWHKVVLKSGTTWEYRVRKPKPRKVGHSSMHPPCEG
jgi:hypothetical protein